MTAPGTPATDPGEPSIEETMRRLVAEALSRELAEVQLSSSLMGDLGAESLDLLDLVFRIEQTFGIEITRGEMERAARGDMPPEAFAPGGVISEAGIARLRALMPEAAERIAPGLRPFEIPTLFTVQTFANIVRRKREGATP